MFIHLFACVKVWDYVGTLSNSSILFIYKRLESGGYKISVRGFHYLYLVPQPCDGRR